MPSSNNKKTDTTADGSDDEDEEITGEVQFKADSPEFKEKIDEITDGAVLYDFLNKQVMMSAFVWGKTHTFNRALSVLHKANILPPEISRKFGKCRKKDKKVLRQLFADLTNSPANRVFFFAVKRNCVLGEYTPTDRVLIPSTATAVSSTSTIPAAIPASTTAADKASGDQVVNAAMAAAAAVSSESAGTSSNRKRGVGRKGAASSAELSNAAALLQAAISSSSAGAADSTAVNEDDNDDFMITDVDTEESKRQKEKLLQQKAQLMKLKSWQVETATLQSAVGSEAYKTLPANLQKKVQQAWLASLLGKRSAAEVSSEGASDD